MDWKYIADFEKLSPMDVYNILKLRQDIFIIEQDCIYEDIDFIDPDCGHLMLYEGEKLIAYARIVPAGVKFDKPSIGRITVASKHRGKGLGRKLVEESIQIIKKNRTHSQILIEAQVYLQKFYESLGFRKISDPYDVDGIDHIKMIRTI